MVMAETMMHCNALARFAHSDVYFLVKGADDLVIRTLINYDSGWDSKADLMVFLQDMRQQAARSAGGRDPAVIVDPNPWFIDKLWIILSDIGSNY